MQLQLLRRNSDLILSFYDAPFTYRPLSLATPDGQIQSAGVLLAGLLIWYDPRWKWADPIATLFFVGLVRTTLVAFPSLFWSAAAFPVLLLFRC